MTAILDPTTAPTQTVTQTRSRFALSRATWVLIALAVVALALVAYSVFGDMPRAWQFILPRRIVNVLGMVVIGCAIGASTVVFHTLTGNRILTPSLMGFDSLYVLLQTIIIFVFTSSIATRGNALMFGINMVLMVGFSMLLFGLLFFRTRISMHKLLLIGIIFGTLFRSVSSLLERMIDPGEYQILADRRFAVFSFTDPTLLAVTAAIVAVGMVVFYTRRHVLDVMLLGRDVAVGLGIDYKREMLIALAAISSMVAAATALVGPVLFFGLLVANLGYLLVNTRRHAIAMAASSLLGIVALVGGQLILARVFSFNTALSVIIEFLGGIAFLWLLLYSARKSQAVM